MEIQPSSLQKSLFERALHWAVPARENSAPDRVSLCAEPRGAPVPGALFRPIPVFSRESRAAEPSEELQKAKEELARLKEQQELEKIYAEMASLRRKHFLTMCEIVAKNREDLFELLQSCYFARMKAFEKSLDRWSKAMGFGAD